MYFEGEQNSPSEDRMDSSSTLKRNTFNKLEATKKSSDSSFMMDIEQSHRGGNLKKVSLHSSSQPSAS